MTIVNVSIDKNCAVIATDTACRIVDADRVINVDKQILLPSIRAVIVARGTLDTLVALGIMRCCSTFDDLIEKLPEFLSVLPSTLQRPAGTSSFEAEVTAVGFSEKQNRFVGLQYTIRDDNVTSTPILGNLVSPGWAGLDSSADFSLPQEMAYLARRQVIWARGLDPAAPVGGRLIFTVIERGCLRSGTLCDLESGEFFTGAAAAVTSEVGVLPPL